ncbi:unnamed protein product [Staurois parvus]|uniref:Uncharacterized protein n=1 Tax=Staurois parvus TaxID=386267 RepID=A0ABN9H8P1_9NEOB|nr:unnamed protein product [Staurois parvus]
MIFFFTILGQFSFDNKKKSGDFHLPPNESPICPEKKQGMFHLDVQSSCDDMHGFTNTCQSGKIVLP